MRRYLLGTILLLSVIITVLHLDYPFPSSQVKSNVTEQRVIIPTAISSGIVPDLKAAFPVYLTPLPIMLEVDPTQFSIVYVTDYNAIKADHLLSPTGELGRIMQARNAFNMDDLQRLHSEKPIEALVIHESAIGLLDPSWINTLYRQGVVLAAVNVKYIDLVTLRNCPNPEDLASQFTGGVERTADTFYYVMTKSVFSDNPETNATIQSFAYDQCQSFDSDTFAEMPGEIYVSASSSQGKLETQNDVVNFVEAVTLNIGRSRSAH